MTVTFTGFTGTGFEPTPAAGRLSSADWQINGFSDGALIFDGTATSGDLARGASAMTVATAGVWAFNTTTGNPSLGVKPGTDDFTPGTITARFTNSSGHPLTKFTVAYTIYVRNSTARTDSLAFAWSLDNATFTTINTPNFTYTSPGAADGSPSWTSVARTTDITATIPVNGKLYLRWSGDDPNPGDDLGDELGLDDISITLQAGCGNAVPESGEECDDGNTSNADACLNTCVIAACGDGFVRTTGSTPEQCDGTVCCSNNCTRLTGTTCQGSGTCNNGVCVGGGQGGETGMAGDSGLGGDNGIGGDNTGDVGGEAGAAQQGGTGGRGGRGGRGGMAGTEMAGTSGGGTAGTEAAGTAGTVAGGNAGTAGTTANGGGGMGASAGTSTAGKAGSGGSGGKAGSSSGGSGAKPSGGGSSGSSDDDSGCGCSVPRGNNHGTLALVAAGALATLMRRRRRNR